jgi:peroxiredoxin Q/BCP
MFPSRFSKFDFSPFPANLRLMRNNFLSKLSFAFTYVFATLLAIGAESTSPKVGDTAPMVGGKDQSGKPWRLQDVMGRKIVLLYFYPKDNTPGCTKEACGLRDRMEDLKTNNVSVVGVSFDSSESHQKFIEQQKLNFTLIADTEGKIADAYGARMASGKNIARRVSFLIGLDGKIVHVTDTPSAETHLVEMKAAIAKLKK